MKKHKYKLIRLKEFLVEQKVVGTMQGGGGVEVDGKALELRMNELGANGYELERAIGAGDVFLFHKSWEVEGDDSTF